MNEKRWGEEELLVYRSCVKGDWNVRQSETGDNRTNNKYWH